MNHNIVEGNLPTKAKPVEVDLEVGQELATLNQMLYKTEGLVDYILDKSEPNLSGEESEALEAKAREIKDLMDQSRIALLRLRK